ncbi:hypothetical protein BTH42_10950 [Burkholderia sp. SRS-W-2-2016]|uniref:alpha/beta hydrolase n=1 Tax=Burkholderia sp. SRS-W-2-2016 TaxID=1926878 RepID=UPI00094B179E|nr:alpha/beta hydrolase [Burkholderia sp. SRS-W-2-2016]OLL31457.1 hypothetical protein BTH42_10950 [Burkholderia sp. SRS-W-2-2016]
MTATASIQDAEYQYVTGQGRPSFGALLASFEARSAAALAAPGCRPDLRYGPGPREVFDFFPASGTARGTLIYFHAGYWQSRDKSTFRFIAPAFTPLGLNVALVNYPLCPSVSLDELLAAVRASIEPVARAAGDESLPLIFAGHSAGGHLAVELALAPPVTTPPVAGVIALSGIYDLAPLVDTTLNRNLRLDAAAAARHSPLPRAHADCANALFAVGGAETPAFIEQSRQMCDAWQRAGNRAALEVTAQADHFTLLEAFTAPAEDLHRQAAAFLDDVLNAIDSTR